MPLAASFKTGRKTLTGSADRVTTRNGIAINIRNLSPSNTIYLGNSSVTSADGYPVYPLESVTLDVVSISSIYAIGSASDEVAYIIIAQ